MVPCQHGRTLVVKLGLNVPLVEVPSLTGSALRDAESRHHGDDSPLCAQLLKAVSAHEGAVSALYKVLPLGLWPGKVQCQCLYIIFHFRHHELPLQSAI